MLVHGIGGGAWFFFEVVTLLKAAGYSASAIDLTANGISKVVADEVVTVVQYTQPLLDFLASIDGQVMTIISPSADHLQSFINVHPHDVHPRFSCNSTF